MGATHLVHTPILRTSIAEVTDVCCTAPQSRAGCEEHNDTAGFIFPRRGVFEWHSQGNVVIADSTTALFVGSGRFYRIGHPAPGGDDCTTLRIAPDMLSDALPLPLHSLHAVVLSSAAQRCVQLSMVQLRTQQPGALAGDELAVSILHAVCTALGAVDGLNRNVKEIADVRCLIALHPEQDLTLPQIARAVHISPYHLARRFRMVTGTSIHQYRTRLRLALAMERISEGWSDLAALALDLGFAHHSHFTLAFRKTYGIRPSELRRLAGLNMRSSRSK